MPVMGTIQFPRRLLGSSTVAFSLLGLWKICSSCHRQLTILWQHGAAVFAPKQSGLTPRIGKHCAQQQETAAVSPGIHFTGENEQAPSRQRHNMSWKGHWALSPLPLVAAHRARWREPGEPFAQAPRARHAPSVHACRDERWSPLVPSSLLFSSSYWSSYEKTFRVETIRFQPDVTALSTTGQMSSLGEALSFFFFGGGGTKKQGHSHRKQWQSQGRGSIHLFWVSLPRKIAARYDFHRFMGLSCHLLTGLTPPELSPKVVHRYRKRSNHT